MAAHIQVILREDVDKLGKSGDLVRVRPGFARNFLLPRGMASVATRGNIERIEHEQKAAVARAGKMKDAAKGEAERIAALNVQVTKQAGDEGKLYGSVTAQDVANALASKGFQIDRRKLVMPTDAIKQVGEYEVKLKLASEVEATFKLEVVAQK